MNPLLARLHRTYRLTGIPCLEQQARDLGDLAAAERAERLATALRAATGYVRAKREARLQDLPSRTHRLLG